MNRNFFSGRFRSAIITLLPALALMATQSVHAALIDPQLGVGVFPDVNTASPDISYDFTAGVGGIMTINGRNTSPGTAAVPNQPNVSSQSIDFSSSTAGCATGSTSGPGGGACYLYDVAGTTSTTERFTQYNLTAYFNANGFFTGGTLSILGYLSPTGLANAPVGWANSGTVLSGNLVNFGFSGTPGTPNDTLRAQFVFNLTGGDLYTIGARLGSLNYLSGVATGLTGTGTSPLAAANTAYGTSALDWDGLTTGTQQRAFMQDFSYCTGCSATLDTMVPVPGAVWLFGSGLIALIGIARRRIKIAA
jgi:hypothetical protein